MTRSQRRIAFGTVAALAMTMLTIQSAGVAAEKYQPIQVQKDTPVPVRDVPGRSPGPDHEAEAHQAQSVKWPGAHVVVVDLPTASATVSASANPRAKAGGLPVWVGRPERQTVGLVSGAARVRVETLDQDAAQRMNLAGTLIRVARADGGKTDAPITLEVDYSGFRHAYGGDWASGLQLVQVPACAVSTPDRAECAAVPVPTKNVLSTRRLTADISAPATDEGATYAVTAEPSGGSGDYTATDLAASSQWTAGGSSGNFNWSYPMRTPPVWTAQPKVGLSYSSGAVDGRTVSTNNQVSWAGEGFSLSPGSITRSHKGCAEDMAGGNNTVKTGDLCWAGDTVSLALDGHSSDLVHDAATGKWRMRNDDGTRVELLHDVQLNNGDKFGDYWRVTTTDGTQYYFGRNRLPGWVAGKPETLSTWTVPVFGNHVGEPCYGATFATSWCYRAWKWNLDHVVDPRGNVVTYYYKQEENYYGRNMIATDDTRYIRSGWLDRIEYGLRSGAEYSPALGIVQFTAAERCVPGGTVTCDPAQLNKDTAGTHWPDVPYFLNCKKDESCTNRLAPSFWTRKRLAVVTTKIREGIGYKPVESWTLTHKFPPSGDGTAPSLWLESIKHTGHIGTAASMPDVTFDGIQLANRVDAMEGLAPLYKRRISVVHNETGGDLFVEYAPVDCVRGSRMPATPDSNTLRCFPQRWVPPGESELLDWFHKTVVARVSLTDLVGLSPTEITSYEYLGGAAWRWDESELVKTSKKTWSQWQGYGKVRVIHGADGDQKTMTESLYLRGMDGDRLASGANRDVKVADSTGALTEDHWRLGGFLREQITFNSPNGAVVSGVINDPWLKGPTAARTRDGRPFQAYLQGTAKVRSRVALAAGGYRTTEVVNTYNDDALVTRVSDLGEPGTADDTCTTTDYARNEAAWMLTYVSQVRTIGLTCGGAPASADDVIADSRTYYDGLALGAAPTKGNVSKVESIASWSSTGSTYRTTSRTTYDGYSRPIETFDTFANKSTIAYTPATGGPVIETKTTNALGHTTVAHIEPAWGQPLWSTDVNGKRTDMQYDAFGRLLKVWLPGRSKAGGQSPNLEFSYLVRKDGPAVTTTRKLRADGGYLESFVFFDGQLRQRQTQAQAPGGRVLSDTVYDSRGLAVKKNAAYYALGVAGSGLVESTDNTVPSQTLTSFDGAGRVIAEILRIKAVEKWRTTTTYGGDRVHVQPPAGATPTTTITDADGERVELRQYRGNTPSGDYDSTKYTYDKRGSIASVVDSSGNTWRYRYDVAGRQIRKEDPDSGVSTMAYDDAGQLTSSVDSRGRTVSHAYDVLGRRTSTHDGPLTAPKVVEWVFDSVAKGQLTAATRYDGNNAYTSTIGAYDDQYRAAKTTITIPAAEGRLAGSYEFTAGYNLAGRLSFTSVPGSGGLAPETIRYEYDSFDRATTMQSGLSTYVVDADYSALGQPLQYALSAGGKWAWLSFFYEEGTDRLARTVTERETAPYKLGDVVYHYDPAGNVTEVTDTPGDGAAADRQCFQYDYLRRLVGAWTPSGACASPAVAGLGGAAPYWHSYSFDKSGNRLSETRHSALGDTVSGYQYPAVGQPQPHTMTSVRTTGPGVDRTDTFGYDVAGNTTSRVIGGETQSLEWEITGRLKAVTKAGQTTTFGYDAQGARLLRREPTGRTLYLPGIELREDSSGRLTARRYYQFGGITVASRSNTGVTWLSADHHGTGQLSISEGSQSVIRRLSTPYGEERGTPSAWPDQRGFVGGVMDPSTGLTSLGAREYDPKLARFLSIDPIVDHGDPQQMNGYSYANGNPVTMSDPDGLRPCGDPIECEYYRKHPEPPTPQVPQSNPRKGGHPTGGNGDTRWQRMTGSSSGGPRRGGHPSGGNGDAWWKASGKKYDSIGGKKQEPLKCSTDDHVVSCNVLPKYNPWRSSLCFATIIPIGDCGFSRGEKGREKLGEFVESYGSKISPIPPPGGYNTLSFCVGGSFGSIRISGADFCANVDRTGGLALSMVQKNMLSNGGGPEVHIGQSVSDARHVADVAGVDQEFSVGMDDVYRGFGGSRSYAVSRDEKRFVTFGEEINFSGRGGKPSPSVEAGETETWVFDLGSF